MAKEVSLVIKTQGGEETLKNINDITTAIKKLEEESKNMDLGSDAFENSKTQIDELKQKLGELSKSQKQIDKEISENAKKNAESLSRAGEQAAQRMEKIGNNVQKFAAGLTDAFAGAFIALGASEKDAEEFNKTLQQGVGIAIGVKGGIEAMVAAVELAGPAFEALNAIIAANPIGAVVIAVAALAAGIYLLVKAIDTEEESLTAVNDSLRRNRESHIENEKELKKISLEKQLREKTISQEQYNRALGEIDLQDKIKENADFTSKEIIKLYEKYGYDINKQLVLRQKRQDYYTREGVLIQDTAWAKEKKAYDNFNIEYNAIKKAALDKSLDDKKFIDAKTAEATDKFNDAEVEKNSEKNKKKLEDDKKAADDLFNQRNQQLKTEAELLQKEYELLQKQKAYELALLGSSRQAEFDADENARKIRFSNRIKNAEADLLGDENNKSKRIELLRSQMAEEIRVAQETGENVYNIKAKYAKKEEDLNRELTQKKIQSINSYVQGTGQALNSIVGAFQAYADLQKQEQEQDTKNRQESLERQLTSLNETRDAELAKEGVTNDQKIAINNKYAQEEYELKLEEYNRSTSLKKAAFEQNKRLQIATTVINTITAAMGAFASLSSIPYVGYVLGGLAAAAIAVTGAIQVDAIKKQQFDAGSPPMPPKIQTAKLSESNVGTGTQNGPNLYSVNGDSDQGLGNGKRTAQRSSEPIKAYVVSQEVTSSQNMNAVIERRSSF